MYGTSLSIKQIAQGEQTTEFYFRLRGSLHSKFVTSIRTCCQFIKTTIIATLIGSYSLTVQEEK